MQLLCLEIGITNKADLLIFMWEADKTVLLTVKESDVRHPLTLKVKTFSDLKKHKTLPLLN